MRRSSAYSYSGSNRTRRQTTGRAPEHAFFSYYPGMGFCNAATRSEPDPDRGASSSGDALARRQRPAGPRSPNVPKTVDTLTRLFPNHPPAAASRSSGHRPASCIVAAAYWSGYLGMPAPHLTAALRLSRSRLSNAPHLSRSCGTQSRARSFASNSSHAPKPFFAAF